MPCKSAQCSVLFQVFKSAAAGAVQCFCWWKLVVQWREKQRLMEIGAWFDACLTLAAVSCLQSVPAHANALSIGVDGDGRAAAAGNGGYF